VWRPAARISPDRPANFDHAGITTNCFSCHNGTTATGKHPTHIPTGNACELCHSNQRWVPATFDHTGISNNCFSCHNGTTATGKHPNHIPTNNECELCHTSNGWTPATFDHVNVTPGTCSSCHNGVISTGMSIGHFSTTLSCDRCHNTNRWTPADFDHAGTAYPGDHSVNLSCTNCHGGNSQAVTWIAPQYQPDCAGCHFNDYRPGVDRHNGINNDRNCQGAGCHNVRDREW